MGVIKYSFDSQDIKKEGSVFDSQLLLFGVDGSCCNIPHEDTKQESKKKEPVPSCDRDLDRGFAWVVLAASFVGHVLQFGVVWTVGVFYVVFLDTFDAGNGAVAMISSLNTAVYYLTGPLAAMLTNKYGCRKMSLIGSVIGSLGLITSMFASNIYHLYVTFGIISGFGLGLAYIPTISMVGFYFEKKRNMAAGIACSGTGIGTFLFPPLIRFLIAQFGWRGTLLLVGGLCLNLCVCAALFRPKDIQVDTREKKAVAPSERTGIFSVRILKNIPYLILCINNFLVCFGLSIIYVHLASYATSIGFDEDQGAMLFSTLGIANFFGRAFFGIVAQAPCIQPTLLYAIAFFLSGLATQVCSLATSFAGMMSYAAFFGATTGAFGSLLPPIIIDMLDINFLTLGYGYIMIFEAMGTLLGAPVAGWFYDYTQMYETSLYLGGAVIMAGAMVMGYPAWKSYKRNSAYRAASTTDILNEPNFRESCTYISSV